MKFGFAANLLGFIVISALSVLIDMLLRSAGVSYGGSGILNLAVSFCLLCLLFIIFRSKIIAFLQKVLINILFKLIGNRLVETIGLVQVYDNFMVAKDFIRQDFIEAKNVKILIQLGRGIIGGAKSLLFEDARKKKDSTFKFHLIFADLNSPFLSGERAKERGSSIRVWNDSTKYTEGSVKALQDEHVNIIARKHCEPYLINLFIFDNMIYAVPYIFEKKNHELAPVFKIQGSNTPTLFNTLVKYFDNIWEKNSHACVE
jgi:hypothetical protein